MKTDIKSLTLEELKKELTEMGEKPFRAAQIYEWLHVRLVRSFDEIKPSAFICSFDFEKKSLWFISEKGIPVSIRAAARL